MSSMSNDGKGLSSYCKSLLFPFLSNFFLGEKNMMRLLFLAKSLKKKVASCSTFLPQLSQLSRLVSRLLHRFGDELRDLEAHL